MSESLVSQITIGDVERNSINEKTKRRVIRTKKCSKEMYLDAVNKINSLSDIDVARKLRVNRTTVWRFRTNPNNHDVILRAKELLNKKIIENNNKLYSRKYENWECYNNLPVIVEWRKKLKNKFVCDRKANDYIRSFWHVCKYLKVHPDRASIEDVAELNQKAKDAYYSGNKMPRGLAYTSIREGIRSFYSVMKNMSMEYISCLGITKEASLGQGKYAKQKISKTVRHRLEHEIRVLPNLNDNEKLEAIYADKWMYYTGSRVSASLEFSFRDRHFSLEKDRWTLEILDKGIRGGKTWEKYLIGYALEDFKKYFSERFDIPIDELETELPRKTDHLFPSFVRIRNNRQKGDDGKLGEINKKCLIKAGLPYDDFPPNHIFRHTFAQDFLASANWNYELTASIGGWGSSHTLKRHYGAIGTDPKINGLRKAMGEKIEETKRLLIF